MRCRSFAVVVAVAAAGALLAPVGAGAQTAETPRTAWGAPDLQGVWDFRSLTPMERPAELADQEVFTSEQAASFSEEILLERSRDQEDAEAAAARGRVVAYNDFWFDWGSSVTTDRTSLIVEPRDGRIPALVAAAERRVAAREAARAGVGRDEVAPGGWIDELSPSVRCITGFNQGRR